MIVHLVKKSLSGSFSSFAQEVFFDYLLFTWSRSPSQFSFIHLVKSPLELSFVHLVTKTFSDIFCSFGQEVLSPAFL